MSPEEAEIKLREKLQEAKDRGVVLIRGRYKEYCDSGTTVIGACLLGAYMLNHSTPLLRMYTDEAMKLLNTDAANIHNLIDGWDNPDREPTREWGMLGRRLSREFSPVHFYNAAYKEKA